MYRTPGGKAMKEESTTSLSFTPFHRPFCYAAVVVGYLAKIFGTIRASLHRRSGMAFVASPGLGKIANTIKTW
jgi:hypothetical protein